MYVSVVQEQITDDIKMWWEKSSSYMNVSLMLLPHFVVWVIIYNITSAIFIINYPAASRRPTSVIIIHQTHYEKSDWSRAFNQSINQLYLNVERPPSQGEISLTNMGTFNQFTIACELDMINAISAADIAFIMSSSTSAWLLSPLECSPQKQNGWTLRFCFWGWIMWKMYNKIIIEFGFRMISWIIKTLCLCYLPQPSASADNTDLGFANSWYHVQPHPIIV